MIHYERREGYQRAALYTQCRPRGQMEYGVGSYLQTDQGKLVSPVMVDLVPLYPWIRMLGWEQISGLHGLVYERKELDVPDACYLGQTDQALAEYDTATDRRACPMREEQQLYDAVREAFARDTADRNPRADALRIGFGGANAPGGESWLRRMVRQWRTTPPHARGSWFLFTCDNPTCTRSGRVVGSGRLEASGPRACPSCHELTTYRSRSA